MVRNIIALSLAEARIHSHICGDGYIGVYKCKRSKGELQKRPRKIIYRNKYSVRYFNNELTLLDSFSRDVKYAYGLDAICSKGERQICGKWLYARLKKLGAGKSKEWFISDEIMCSSNEIVSAWLSAFFDDEGHVDCLSNYITLSSVNFGGLKQIEQLLRKLGFEKISICGPYYYKEFFSYRLKILSGDIVKFQRLIGFTHPKKAKDLESLVSKKLLKSSLLI